MPLLGGEEGQSIVAPLALCRASHCALTFWSLLDNKILVDEQRWACLRHFFGLLARGGLLSGSAVSPVYYKRLTPDGLLSRKDRNRFGKIKLT